ncbi:hypothetical protein L1999_01470 [Neobacillus drentensis]|uniref:hypothetical protein n=1 Tax=Neobacillus drentensis TaxID=220684 RepID=UPI001F37451D|nr:hypothetical protein [Neobacillus drentensis]ULT57310.1 hypothetical protein L1999_01470 [Neobacillus drentensis]
MIHLLYYTTPFIAAFIIYGGFFRYKKPTILTNKIKYYHALEELEKDPKNEELKLVAREFGRKFYGSARITGIANTFDESLINCEIIASCEADEKDAK